MVVSLYQAKRSVANGALYDGTVITGWPVLYSGGHHRLCQDPRLRHGHLRRAYGLQDHLRRLRRLDGLRGLRAYYVANVTSSFTGVEGAKVILSNASEDSTAAVNALLQAGKGVG